LALSVAPFDARAKAGLDGLDLVRRAQAHQTGSAVQMSRDALARDATVVAAWRNLALAQVLGQNVAGARRFFQISERLSRRDPATQLWLIEDAVQRNDIDNALRHYDIALRTSPSLAQSLAPILVNATSYEPIGTKLAVLLAGNPPWAGEYFRYLAGMLPSGDAAARLVSRLPVSVREGHIDRLRLLIPAAVERRNYRAAWQIYALLARQSPDALVRDRTFANANTLPPFEWEFMVTTDARAEPAAGSGTNAGLRIAASSGAIATTARQLLVLRPGTYRLRSVSENGEGLPPDRLDWKIKCVGSDSEIATLPITPSRSGRTRNEGAFRVPDSGCAAQWIALEISATESPGGSDAWVHRLDIERAGRPSG
jgi:hypothetical protein